VLFRSRALELKPSYPEAQFNRALALLATGDYPAGFEAYEARFLLAQTAVSQTTAPVWDGSSLDGKTILLHAEQGYGDAIQFARFVAPVAALGGNITVACQPALMRLFESLEGVSAVTSLDADQPPCDTHAPLASLARILRTTVTTVPADTPYLTSPDAPWSFPDANDARLRVGLAWSGSTSNKINKRRSCPPDQLLPLIETSDVAFFSLQVTADENADIPAGVTDLAPRINDFADSAAAIQGLDLVITIDTATAHLAGALGKPVLVMLSLAGDWRYLQGRSDSPWYPTMQLFRQPEVGDWESVVAAVTSALVKFQP